jgi:hypothetical protein
MILYTITCAARRPYRLSLWQSLFSGVPLLESWPAKVAVYLFLLANERTEASAQL